MAVTTIGLTSLFFGTASSGSQVVSSYEETYKCEPVELMNGNGTFQAVAYPNAQVTINGTIISGTATGLVGASLALLTTGNTFLTMTGISTFYIENISRNATNDGFTETTITAMGWQNLGSTS
ncbi:MAG: hypothetical protein EBT78_08015 [Betaproteobacteria bacterium]|nr:hypothetical protein [Betaproteobacteria bacterium]